MSRIIFFQVWLIVISSLQVFAQIPKLISYQGYLTDDTGNPVSGSKDIEFSLYTFPEGGPPIWSEVKTIDVDRGLFQTNLGSENPLDLPFDRAYYLGIRVDGGEEMQPRITLTSSPYALGPMKLNLPLEWSEDANIPVITVRNRGAGPAVSGHFEQGGNKGMLGDREAGVIGNGSSGNKGLLGSNDYAVFGQHWLSGNEGFIGGSDYGIYGKHEGSGNRGSIGGQYSAIQGFSKFTETYIGSDYYALLGKKNLTVNGKNGDDQYYSGYIGTDSCGVMGLYSHNNNYGYLGGEFTGAFGKNRVTNNWGSLGGASFGVAGMHDAGQNLGYLGHKDYGVYGEHIDGETWGSLGSANAGAEGHYSFENKDFPQYYVWELFGENRSSGAATEHHAGRLGDPLAGVFGEGKTGVLGFGYEASGAGVKGMNQDGPGISGMSNHESGVVGMNMETENWGALGTSHMGVFGKYADKPEMPGNLGYLGSEEAGAGGVHALSKNEGFLGLQHAGVEGRYYFEFKNNDDIKDPWSLYTELRSLVKANDLHLGMLGHHEAGVFGQGKLGVLGYGSGASGVGVFGLNDQGPGVEGMSDSKSGVIGTNNHSGNRGELGSPKYGVYGEITEVSGEIDRAAVGGSNAATANSGMLGSEIAGVVGLRSANKGTGMGVYGMDGELRAGGISGVVHEGYLSGPDGGAFGGNQQYENFGILGTPGVGVYGQAMLATNFAVRGYNEGGKVFGYLGGMYMGVYGKQSEETNKWGYLGGKTWSGSFGEDVSIGRNCFIYGNLTKAGGSFRIDHPLDPENKYLNHSFVESPEMTNIYHGNTVLNAEGMAEVILPDWFEALNKDFTYQLTPIGGPASGLYIAEEISQNRFTIAGGTPGLKVSWMVTGVRQDKWAQANPVIVEQEKEANLKGFYIHPELFGMPAERQIEYGLDKDLMKALGEPEQNPTPITPGKK